jgi:predicted nuclease with TOPRIM domain
VLSQHRSLRIYNHKQNKYNKSYFYMRYPTLKNIWNTEEALKEALRIHEEREEYLERVRKERSNQAASAGMLQSMMEENRRLEERSKAAEEEAETLKSFMEGKRSDRANESKAIGVLKLGLTKEQDKNRVCVLHHLSSLSSLF